jgi:hypothetical protein
LTRSKCKKAKFTLEAGPEHDRMEFGALETVKYLLFGPSASSRPRKAADSFSMKIPNRLRQSRLSEALASTSCILSRITKKWLN